jgi:hypothetical protein
MNFLSRRIRDKSNSQAGHCAGSPITGKASSSKSLPRTSCGLIGG